MASLHIGPTDRNPHVARNEYQYAFIKLAQTAVLVAAGGGTLHTITIGVVGTLAKFFDTPSGGTADDTTEIATVDISAVQNEPIIIDIAFAKGLTCVVTGAAAEITVSFLGAPTVSPRTFGAIGSTSTP